MLHLISAKREPEDALRPPDFFAPQTINALCLEGSLPTAFLLLSNHEVDSGNDFYPKIEDAAEEKPAGAEVRMDAVPDCKVDSMKTEDRRLATTTGGLQ